MQHFPLNLDAFGKQKVVFLLVIERLDHSSGSLVINGLPIKKIEEFPNPFFRQNRSHRALVKRAASEIIPPHKQTCPLESTLAQKAVNHIPAIRQAIGLAPEYTLFADSFTYGHGDA